ncbi:MAG: hypothetical protein HC811_04440 [Flammeovirgaceae bacterium]|nr:hypothetical protein [Flammeovirgaceae bacterium]
MPDSSSSPHLTKQKQILSLLVLALVVVHLLVVLILTGSERINKKINQYRPAKLYKIFAIPGPFFSEDRINNTVQLYLKTKSESTPWTDPVQLGSDEFNNYHSNYLRYDQLCESGIARFLARQIVYDKKQYPDSSRFFRELNRYIITHQLANHSDSLQVIFIMKKFETYEVDTLFHYTFQVK